ncbi:hypothetical protein EDB84DRAFT_1642668 [Lactarius hengduanensis]|nr:hypothetical protein EDB84DRAFT_1642668 [Lactarius hengduanensis]
MSWCLIGIGPTMGNPRIGIVGGQRDQIPKRREGFWLLKEAVNSFCLLGRPFYHLLLCRLEDHPDRIDVSICDPADLSRSVAVPFRARRAAQEEEWAVDANVFISQEDDDTQVYSIRLKTFYDGTPLHRHSRPATPNQLRPLPLSSSSASERCSATAPPAAVDLLEKHHPPQHHWRRSSNSSGDSTAAGTGAGAAALAVVKAVLENAPNSISSEKFEARVKELAEKERRMCETRELELRVLGFGPPNSVHGHEGLIVLAYKKATSLRKVNPVAGSIPKDFCIGWDKVTTTATRTKMTTTTATQLMKMMTDNEMAAETVAGAGSSS